jgi:hypothetical protein
MEVDGIASSFLLAVKSYSECVVGVTLSLSKGDVRRGLSAR